VISAACDDPDLALLPPDPKPPEEVQVMRELRWLLRVAPPVAAVVALVALGVASIRATATGCGLPAAAAATPNAAAFAISPSLDASGTLAGERLQVSTAGRETLRLDLPPESFAGGPFGAAILVGADDGRRSTLRAVDATSGCAWSIGTERDVIRRATIDRSGLNDYEFRVERVTRADLGVWRRPLAGGAPVRVLEPLPADDRYGVTFSTELSWSVEGDTLVVQSCGLTNCRTRLLDVASGAVRTVETEDQGEVIGLAGGEMITYGACRGVPCSIAAIDPSTAERTTLVEAANAASIVATAGGPRLVAETGADADRALVLIDPASAASKSVPADIHGWRLVPSQPRAGGAVSVPPGRALLSRDGRAPYPGDAAEVIDVQDGATLNLAEVTR
jgi:hypothetical protein